MRKTILFIALGFLIQTECFARRAALPLMPPRDLESMVAQTPTRNAASKEKYSDSKVMYRYRESKEVPTRFGIELGTIGRKASTKADALGMQFLMGGRILAAVALSENFHVKPSLGYFTRKESLASISIRQQDLEAGVMLNYALLNRRAFNWYFGLSQRLSLTRSEITILSNTENTPNAWLYRVGPSTEFTFDVSNNTQILIDAEMTFLVQAPSRLYSGLTLGIAFGF